MVIMHLNPQDDIQKRLDEFPIDESIKIFLESGIYHQKLRIKHGNLMICGESKESTILTWDDYALKIHPDGLAYNTFRTPTLTLYGNRVVLQNLTIENTAGLGTVKGQAVALSIYGDDVTLIDCHLKAHQDTLFCGPLPLDLTVRYLNFLPMEDLVTAPTHHHFQNCTIEGDVDFIFGGATAWFDNCEINCTGRGYISAPSTAETTTYGLIFTECAINNTGSSEQVLLGRPWRSHGSSLFLNCTFSGAFQSERFDAWEKPVFRFKEHPFIESKLSSDMTSKEITDLKQYLKNHFPQPVIL